MTDRLLPHYHGELNYIRRLMDEFAAQRPDAAGRLRIRKGATDDPHVERLIEAFAYLTARIRMKLDDEFPEITDAFLNVLYPHYLAPVPSAAIVQFVLDPSQGELTTGYALAKGAGLEVCNPGDVACRFRTCYDITLWPIEVAACELPWPRPATPWLSCA
jgi:type VI secretion system protein ImpG